MNLEGTQTLVNLARSFAGESQARGRYHFYADKMKSEGHESLYRRITEIENNELAHSKIFMDFITQIPSFGYDNIEIDGGYPYKLGAVCANLKAAAHGENEEATVAYPKFAKIAKDEGFHEIASAYELIAKIEAEHEKIFSAMLMHLENGTLYKRNEEIKWKCENCGFEYTSNSALEMCPVCSKPIGYMRGDL